MKCVMCDGSFDIRTKGENTGMAFFQCTTCGYSCCAKESHILRMILEHACERAGVDPNTITNKNPKTVKELEECRQKLNQ